MIYENSRPQPEQNSKFWGSTKQLKIYQVAYQIIESVRCRLKSVNTWSKWNRLLTWMFKSVEKLFCISRSHKFCLTWFNPDFSAFHIAFIKLLTFQFKTSDQANYVNIRVNDNNQFDIHAVSDYKKWSYKEQRWNFGKI